MTYAQSSSGMAKPMATVIIKIVEKKILIFIVSVKLMNFVRITYEGSPP